MLIGVQSYLNPDVGFVVEVNEQNEKLEKAKELIVHGFQCWICFGSTEFPTEYFNEDDALWIESCGYAEPSIELLDEFDISHGNSYACFDEDGELINPWNETEIEWVY